MEPPEEQPTGRNAPPPPDARLYMRPVYPPGQDGSLPPKSYLRSLQQDHIDELGEPIQDAPFGIRGQWPEQPPRLDPLITKLAEMQQNRQRGAHFQFAYRCAVMVLLTALVLICGFALAVLFKIANAVGL